MKITFVSNYINHHQIPLSSELYAVLGEDYRFVQTEEMEEERVNMGWDADTDSLPYLLKYYEKPQECQQLIADSDVVIYGGTDEECYIEERLQAGKPVIRYSERIYKSGQWKAISPRGLRKKYHDHTRYRDKDVYLLCAGAYVPSDFHIVRSYPGKMFRWGYFPPFTEQDVDNLLQRKAQNKVPRILWSGRFIDWKHPEDALLVASFLKKEDIAFELYMVGGGSEEDKLKALIEQEGLSEQVKLLGFLQPEDVRKEMEQADVFLFTSDYKEGWGAVLNESMNSGCAVVANVAAGASPWLIAHGKNGLLYQNGDTAQLKAHVKYLLQQKDVRQRMGRAAYETIAGTWNAKNAAQTLLLLCKRILGETGVSLPEMGPGSHARVVSQRSMYERCVKRGGV